MFNKDIIQKTQLIGTFLILSTEEKLKVAIGESYER